MNQKDRVTCHRAQPVNLSGTLTSKNELANVGNKASKERIEGLSSRQSSVSKKGISF